MATKDIDRSEGKQAPTQPAHWWPGRSLLDLRRQMDDLFEDFMGGLDLPSWWGGGRRGAPAAGAGLGVADVRFEVSEDDKAYQITAELPGMEEKDVDVELSNGMLTIKGEKSAESETKEKNYYLSERSYGAFRRAFRVPEGVDEDKIGADFSKGVLTVTLPKSAEAKAKTKKIDVKSS